jgi:hypothetical protein
MTFRKSHHTQSSSYYVNKIECQNRKRKHAKRLTLSHWNSPHQNKVSTNRGYYHSTPTRQPGTWDPNSEQEKKTRPKSNWKENNEKIKDTWSTVAFRTALRSMYGCPGWPQRRRCRQAGERCKDALWWWLRVKSRWGMEGESAPRRGEAVRAGRRSGS